MTSNRDHELYKTGLVKTRGSIWGRIRAVFTGGITIGEEQLERIEEILITADIGVEYTARFIEHLRKSSGSIRSDDEMKMFMSRWIAGAVSAQGKRTPDLPPDPAAAGGPPGPRVMLVVGVNGSGKTTTIGKLAHRLGKTGRSTMLVAADTYRAAAVKQLEIWARRAGAAFHGALEGGDPAAVVHDALSKAVSAGTRDVIIDTAGRLHTKEPLMRELEKIVRVAERIVEGAPHEVMLVLDATTGQNALVQAREFAQAAGVTGVTITKMDGTARGGILIPIAGELGLPIQYVGLGEGIEDLVPFDPEEYAKGIIGD
ncbi:MAG: signal recognition particle-docking protein FtsY [bacterium]|nr:signal recognition particle-docking protein FtsY [bacterium]MDT8396646.1 signal recognition particle-docking protein FtsY [bacterium]